MFGFFFSQIHFDPSLVLSFLFFSLPFFFKSSSAAHFLVFCMKIRLAKFAGKEEILSEKSSRCKEKLAVDSFTKTFYLCKSGRIGQNFPK